MALYLSAKFQIHAHKAPEFGPIGRRVCEIIIARAGWQLVAALTAVTGRLNECTHIWKVPDANAHTLLPQLLKPEDFPTVEAFGACVCNEEYQLLSALEYHPERG